MSSTTVLPLDRVDVGDSATAIYTVTNSGNVTLSAVEVGGSLGPLVECPQADLAPSESQDCTVTIGVSQADIDAGMVDASVSVSVSATTPNASTVSGAVTHGVSIDRVSDIDITTSQTGVTSNGDGTYTVDYTLAVTNTRNTTLSAMNLLDGLGVTFPDAKVTLVSWTPNVTGPFSPTLVLLPGNIPSATYVVEVRPAGDPGPYISVSVVTATSPTGDVSDASLAIVQFDVNYDLVLTHDAPTSVAQGATHPHLITITNTRPAAALGPTMLTMTVDTSTPFKSYHRRRMGMRRNRPRCHMREPGQSQRGEFDHGHHQRFNQRRDGHHLLVRGGSRGGKRPQRFRSINKRTQCHPRGRTVACDGN